MKTEKDIIMMYHTSIRNIGLYTSISLAALAYSRAYRGKGFLRNIAGIMISICLISIAISINYYLYKDIDHFSKKIEVPIIDKWAALLPFIGLIQLFIVIINLFTLYNEINK